MGGTSSLRVGISDKHVLWIFLPFKTLNVNSQLLLIQKGETKRVEYHCLEALHIGGILLFEINSYT